MPEHKTQDIEPGAELRRAARRGLGLVVAAAVVGWAVPWAQHARSGVEDQREVAHWRVPLDRAAVADLELLPGLGPTLAWRLGEVCAAPSPVVARDLLDVPRLGPTGRKRITPWVVFGKDPVEAMATAERTPGAVVASSAR